MTVNYGPHTLSIKSETPPFSTAPAAWQLLAGHFESTNIPLEIIAPYAGLSTTNRYYKTYTGILYEVPVAVLGGSYPYHYSLTVAPSGMTVGADIGDADYGIIKWDTPVESGSPHTITIRVQDQDGGDVSVTYTLTVTTAGFLFVDSVSGSDANAGTIGSPFGTMGGWYGGTDEADRFTTTYSGQFVYYRTGTYPTTDCYLEDNRRVAMGGTRKPLVHMAYPGESPVWNIASGGFAHTGASSNMCYSGIDFGNAINADNQVAVGYDSGGSDRLFYANNWTHQAVAGTGGSNPALIKSSDATTIGERLAISSNTMASNGYMLFLGYRTSKAVIENNTLGQTSTNGFYAKIENSDWSVRANTGLNASTTGRLLTVDAYDTTSDIEASYNNFKTSSVGMQVGPNSGGGITNVWDMRNTWQITHNLVTTVSVIGPWFTTANATLYDGVDPDANEPTAGGVMTITSDRLLLSGTATDFMNTSTGELIGSAASNIGTRGHEVA